MHRHAVAPAHLLQPQIRHKADFPAHHRSSDGVFLHVLQRRCPQLLLCGPGIKLQGQHQHLHMVVIAGSGDDFLRQLHQRPLPVGPVGINRCVTGGNVLVLLQAAEIFSVPHGKPTVCADPALQGDVPAVKFQLAAVGFQPLAQQTPQIRRNRRPQLPHAGMLADQTEGMRNHRPGFQSSKGLLGGLSDEGCNGNSPGIVSSVPGVHRHQAPALLADPVDPEGLAPCLRVRLRQDNPVPGKLPKPQPRHRVCKLQLIGPVAVPLHGAVGSLRHKAQAIGAERRLFRRIKNRNQRNHLPF